MNCILLGAGASKSYKTSPTGVSMPLAKDFFETFFRLEISENPWVMYHMILGYLRQHKQTDISYLLSGHIDIEAFHSEIEQSYIKAFKTKDDTGGLLAFSAYNQLIFIFAAVINSIQNGPVSTAHETIAKALSKDDAIITFNWDTLMDKALEQHTSWRPDFGYLFNPRKVFENSWRDPNVQATIDFPMLIKLHGSTNWITAYSMCEGGQIKLMHDEPNDTAYVFRYSSGPYATYKGRFMPNYEPFSYGYYPPNILHSQGMQAPPGQVFLTGYTQHPLMPTGTAPDQGIPSMPLIIPPVKHKSYNLFGNLFDRLWSKAEEVLIKSDHIIIIGYSFPVTDIQSKDLFLKAFAQRKVMPRITIIDPNPAGIRSKFIQEFGVPDNQVVTISDYFSDKIDIAKYL